MDKTDVKQLTILLKSWTINDEKRETWSRGTNSRLPFAVNAMFNLSNIFTLQSLLSDWSLSIDRSSRMRAVWKGKDTSLIKERKLDYFT